MSRNMVKKIIGMVLALLSVTVVGASVYGYTIYQQGTKTLAKTYKKIGEETKAIEATEPLTILLMGVDTSESQNQKNNDDEFRTGYFDSN